MYHNREEVNRLSDRKKNMRHFFHADTEVYSDALRRALIIVIVPLLGVCAFCTINIILHYDLGFSKVLAIIIAAVVLFGMIFGFSAVYITEKKKRRHARFTFFDIFPTGMVFSEYAGEFIRYGERIILRRLYYIPFADFESVSRNPKKTPREITIHGKMREYFLESNRLGYHIDDNGSLIFDTAILHLGFFTEHDELTIKKRFGCTKRLIESILYYKERFDNIPEKKPFDTSDYVAVRRRPRPKTSNPALEAPSYNRNWK